MTLPLVFRRRFGRDLAGGFDWYEEQRSGLGEEFLSAVQSTLGSVEYQPEMFVSVHGGVRRAMVPRFPFRGLLLGRIKANRGPQATTHGARPEALASPDPQAPLAGEARSL